MFIHRQGRGRPLSRLATLAGVALLFSACGSGDDPAAPPAPVNRAPTANAGGDLTGITGQTLALAGSGTDADGDSLTFEWSIVSGPANGAALAQATAAQAQFTATAAGAYVLRLTARDPANATGSADITVTIATPQVAAITVDTPFLFMSATGQASTLVAQPRDGAGAAVSAPVTWTSSAPTQVNVDSNGHVVAGAVGSAQIFASAGGVTSAPVLVVVAQPQPGAVLVTDAQVESIGAPIGLPDGTAPGVGTRYEVWLRGVTAPAAGTVMLAAETSPVAGKVVSTRTENGALVALLEIAALPDLLARYHIDWDIDLSAFPLALTDPPATATFKSKTAHTGKAQAQSDGPRRLQNFWCEGEIGAKAGGIKLDVTATAGLRLTLQDYRDDPALPPNYSKHTLSGSAGITGEASVDFTPQITASGICRAEGHVQLPVFGWVSLIVMPQVSLGAAMEMTGALIVTEARLGGKLDLTLNPVVGWQCGGTALTCEGLNDITLDPKFTPIQEFDLENGMHAKLAGHLFAYARLDALLFRGLGGYVPILEARLGPKQSLDLTTEPTQAANTSMASSYDLKIDGGVKPGEGLEAAIEKFIKDDAVSVSFGLEHSTPLAESPKGTLRVDKSRVGLGDKVKFNVDIRPETRRYPGANDDFSIAYNIDQIELWRRGPNDPVFQFFRTMAPIASGEATAFEYEWTPEGTDAGTSQFAAFVRTKFALLPALEIEPASVKDVEVACFTAAAKAARGVVKPADTPNTCADTWQGIASHVIDHGESASAQVTWKRDPTYDGGRPTLVRYLATGTFEFHQLAYEEAGCTVTPQMFPVAPPGAPNTNTLIVDYSFVPARFSGSGITAGKVTISCPDDEPFDLDVSMPWWPSALGDVSADGLEIKGSLETPFSRSSFRFARP